MRAVHDDRLLAMIEQRTRADFCQQFDDYCENAADGESYGEAADEGLAGEHRRRLSV